MKLVLGENELSDYWKLTSEIQDYDKKKDDKALREILFTLHDEQLDLVTEATTAHGVWEILRKNYQNKDAANVLNLTHVLYNIQKDDSETIREYITRFNSLVNQINAISKLNKRISGTNKAFMLMKGLPESYDMMCMVLRQNGKMSDYEFVTTSLISEEANKKTDDKAFYTSGQRGTQRGNRRANRHGNQRARGTGRSQQSHKFDGNCNYCVKYGHKEQDCYAKERDKDSNQRGQ